MLDCVTSWVIRAFVDYEQIYILRYISNFSILWKLNLVAQIISYGNRHKFLPPNVGEDDKRRRQNVEEQHNKIIFTNSLLLSCCTKSEMYYFNK